MLLRALGFSAYYMFPTGLLVLKSKFNFDAAEGSFM